MARGVLLVHGLASKNLSNHVTHDTHLGGTAVVKLNVQLAGLLSGVLDISSEVANTVVSRVVGGRHPGKLNKSEEGKDLGKTGGGDGADSINTSWDVGELKVVGWGKVSIEYDVVVVNDGSNNGHHGNTAVLALYGTAALEGLRLGFKPAKRVEYTKGLRCTQFELAHHVEGGGGGLLGNWGEGGGRANKEGGNGELHLVLFKYLCHGKKLKQSLD